MEHIRQSFTSWFVRTEPCFTTVNTVLKIISFMNQFDKVYLGAIHCFTLVWVSPWANGLF